ncbi:MAG: DUF1926 domain-containing protein, partial [Deltaproteobacteria bacterium]|nr:DUF1926 domain-containing protein [Deltaproteobacteria bacterium]
RLLAHPDVRVGLHHSGPLLEWLLREEPSYLTDLAALCQREQVEILGGGFYEPVLPLLSDEDGRGQIEMMTAFTETHLHTTPRGIWLAERAWDPDLPRTLANAGVQYVLLDDSHFEAAGVSAPEGGASGGYFVTEKAGAAVAVFPISRPLRYAIPFRPPEQVIEQIADLGQRLAQSDGPAVVTYGDDGEKFGLWPGTSELMRRERWLERFFDLLDDNRQRVRTTTPSAVLARYPCQGRVYLPTAAYEEMDAWALPTAAGRRLLACRADARSAAPDSPSRRALPFLRGGLFAGFLAKYPEANHMHKKMVQVSAALHEAFVANRAGTLYGDRQLIGDRLATAQRALYAGQCSSAYWHGWFGGIYCAHLRHAVLERLLHAERMLGDVLLGPEERARCERTDFDGDLADEALLGNRQVNVYVAPAQGGTLFAFDDTRRCQPLLNTLARRPEHDHDEVAKLPAAEQARLRRGLVYDRGPRWSFRDRFFEHGVGAERLRDDPGLDRGSFADSPYALVEMAVRDDIDGGVEAVLRADGTVGTAAGTARLRIAKRYLVPRRGAAVQVLYSITHEDGPPLACLFAPEINLALHLPEDARHYLRCGDSRLPIDAAGCCAEVQEIALVDGRQQVATVVSTEGCQGFLRYPIETAARHEHGFVLTFQGVALLPLFALDLRPGQILDLAIVLGVESAV